MIRIAIAILALLLPSVVLAAPSITSGSIGSGVVTVGGSGFGTKSTAAPLHFDSFAEGVVGDTVGQHSTYWSDPTSEANRATYSTDCVRTSGNKSVKLVSPYGDTGADQIIKTNVGFATTGKIYLNYWLRFDYGTSTGNYWQLKSFSLANTFDGNGNLTLPEVALFNYKYYASGYSMSYLANYYYGTGSNTSLNVLDSTSSSHDVIDTVGWYNIVVKVNQGTPGTADGSFSISVSDPAFANPYGTNSRSNTMILGDATNTANKIDAIKLWLYHGDAPTVGGTATHYIDSVYIDNSFATVELCDASTRSASAHCEIQIPTSWSTTSVATTFKQGSFAGGQQVYAYVTDEDGATNSSGYGPLTIPADGGGGGSTGHYYQARVSE